MKAYGLRNLGRAIRDATFNKMLKPFADPLAVIHASRGDPVEVTPDALR